MPYEWDEAKRLANILKHGVDFQSIDGFDWDTSTRREMLRAGEARTVAFGFIGERLYAVVYTQRGQRSRIISMRKANKREFQRHVAN